MLAVTHRNNRLLSSWALSLNFLNSSLFFASNSLQKRSKNFIDLSVHMKWRGG